MTEKNNNLSCEIVKDLLPLYHNKVVSETIAGAVKSHLDTCQKCTEEYNRIKTTLPDENTKKTDRSATEFFKYVNSRVTVKGVIISAIVLTILFNIGYFLTQKPLIKAKQYEYSVEQVYKVDDKFFLLYQAKYGYPTRIYCEKYDISNKELNITFKRPFIYLKFLPYKVDKEHIAFDNENYETVERVTFNDKEIWNIKDNGNDVVPPNVILYIEHYGS